MDRDKIRDFLKYVKTDPEAKEKLSSLAGTPKDLESAIVWYAQAAILLGQDVTEADLTEFIESETTGCAARTEDAAEKIEALSNEDLDAVTGGGKNSAEARCRYSYLDHENCWRKDGCDKNWVDYPLYECAKNSYRGYNQCGHKDQMVCDELIFYTW